MRGALRTGVAILGLCLLTACAGQTKIYNTEVHLGYNPAQFGYAAGRRDLTTVIRGNPFDLEQKAFESTFVDQLNRTSNLVQPTHFTTTPGETARPDYRAVFVFDAGPAPATFYCSQPMRVPVVKPKDKVRLVAAFCRNQGVMTTVTGEVAGLSDIDDPRFFELINQMVTLLFPPIDPTRRNGNPWRLLIVRASEAGVGEGGLTTAGPSVGG
jgi:hypothetical protein